MRNNGLKLISYQFLILAFVAYGWAFEPALGAVIGGAVAHLLSLLFLSILVAAALLYRWFDAAVLSILCAGLYSLISLRGQLRTLEMLGLSGDAASVFTQTSVYALFAYFSCFTFYYLIRFIFETKGIDA
ncbi:hypothetical protein [uncultured Sulfitobacter sp.]|uniref:hypothetical protein n=1 Tax=uncultured Sulfitobacter sp. TaxID=191468 RepID=UPI002633C03D|nr:hypothetical protein [uncultured Sulfitobacter sp.]